MSRRSSSFLYSSDRDVSQEQDPSGYCKSVSLAAKLPVADIRIPHHPESHGVQEGRAFKPSTVLIAVQPASPPVRVPLL